MKFRTRLVLSFAVLTVVTVAVLFLLTVRSSGEKLTYQIRSKVLTLAVAVASEVDGDVHEQIRKAGDEGTDAYRQIEALLRRFRDANRRDDIYVNYIYTMRQVKTDPDEWIYVVDGQETGELKSAIGEVVTWESVEGEDEEEIVLGEAYAEKGFTKDPYGVWLSANAPVRNGAGEIVAMLGVDISAEDVIAARRALLLSSVTALAVALVLGTGVAAILNRWITRPLDTIREGVRQLGEGRLDTRLAIEDEDEFAGVRHALNDMAQSFQERDATAGSLSTYLPKDVADRLQEEDRKALLEGSVRRMSILRCRIRNIDHLAASLPPREFVRNLNHFAESFSEVVAGNEGVVTLVGSDSATAVFGALSDGESQESNAVTAALEILGQEASFNRKRKLADDDAMRFAAAVHTGEAVLGSVGESGIAIVGEANRGACAVEAATDTYDVACLVSEDTQRPLRNLFAFEETGTATRGDSLPGLKLYKVMDRPAASG